MQLDNPSMSQKKYPQKGAFESRRIKTIKITRYLLMLNNKNESGVTLFLNS
jgi:hypothetical protein